MAVKQAKLYAASTEEPRLYPIEKLAAAGVVTTRQLPSVTTILRVLNKPAFVNAAMYAMGQALLEHVGQPVTIDLVNTAKKAWGSNSRKAMDFGTQIHAIAEQHGRTGQAAVPEDAPAEVKAGVKAYLAWIEETGFVATEVEKVIGDAAIGYAGCCDAVGVLRDGRQIMVDWKSGKGGSIYNEYILQWHAYARPLGITEGFIVSFDKVTGECYQHPMKFDSLTFDAFVACVTIYEWLDRR